MLLGITFVVTSTITPAQVYRRARIPVLIPTAVRTSDAGRAVYEKVTIAKPGTYSVHFSAAPDCDANACDVGTITGGAQEPSTDLNAQRVRLRDGTHAAFSPFACGASCGESVLDFSWHHVRYVLRLKAASKAETLKAANSMLP